MWSFEVEFLILTPFDLEVLRPSFHPKLMSNKQIVIKKIKKMVTVTVELRENSSFAGRFSQNFE